MAQWQALLQLDSASQGRVVQLYDHTGFDREIRHTLSASIESQNWDLAALDKSKADSSYKALLMFVEELQRRSIQENNILVGPDFAKIKQYFVCHFNDNPLRLAILLSHCLKEEKKILYSALKAQSSSPLELRQNGDGRDAQIDQLRQLALELKSKIQTVDQMSKNLGSRQKSWEAQEQLCSSTKAALELALHILKQTEPIVQTLTVEEVASLKRRQQLACIGCPVETKLDQLQKWFSGVAQVLLDVCEQLKKLQSLKSCGSESSSSELYAQAQSLFRTLLSKALVVEKQPTSSKLQRPLMLKTEVCFKVTLRFLVCLPEWKSLLKVKPVFDKDVEKETKPPGFRRFDFSSDVSMVMNVKKGSGALVAEFEKLSIKAKQLRTQGTQENSVGVTKELHMITFVLTCQYDRYQQDIQASCLPVVVLTSTNQMPKAWASIMWWNMLSTSEPWDLSLLADPPPLRWDQLAQVLSWQFLSVGQRGLDEDHLSMIKSKILCGSESDLVDWNTFSKNNQTWIWIDGILNLIKTALATLWRDGHIMGFVSKERAQTLLLDKPTGTFVLRFSESIIEGAITFSWVEKSNDQVFVHAVNPYRERTLKSKPLLDCLFNYNVMCDNEMKNPLLFLYPDIPIDVIFGRCCKDSEEPSPSALAGYLPRKEVSISFLPTPPPSPKVPPKPVDTEEDMDTTNEIVIQDLFPSLLDVQAPDDFRIFE